MRVGVDRDECIGCGLCTEDCSEVFEIVHGVSHVIEDADGVDEAYRTLVETAADVCPTAAISIQSN